MSRKKTTMIEVRPAGSDHQVLTFTGGSGGTYRRKPCDDCPWRKDTVGVFPAEAFKHSANTGIDGAYFSPAAMHTFACHASGAKTPATCAGYILQGQSAIGWRIAAATGKFDPSQVTSDVELFASYYDMAVANGVDADDPVLAACRPWSRA